MRSDNRGIDSFTTAGNKREATETRHWLPELKVPLKQKTEIA
jgi:hypothetical protein